MLFQKIHIHYTIFRKRLSMDFSEHAACVKVSNKAEVLGIAPRLGFVLLFTVQFSQRRGAISRPSRPFRDSI